MPEEFGLQGKRFRVANIEEANRIVRQPHPGVRREGSIAHWVWGTDWGSPGNRIVAEMWPVRSSADWWLRVEEK